MLLQGLPKAERGMWSVGLAVSGNEFGATWKNIRQ